MAEDRSFCSVYVIRLSCLVSFLSSAVIRLTGSDSCVKLLTSGSVVQRRLVKVYCREGRCFSKTLQLTKTSGLMKRATGKRKKMHS